MLSMAGKARGRAMAFPTVMLGVLLLVISLPRSGVEGTSSCDATQTASHLAPCLPAVKSNPAPPSHDCCLLINSISSDCLCSCLQSPLARLEGVDLETAIQLPRKCKRVVPPGTKCGAYTIPGSTDDQ